MDSFLAEPESFATGGEDPHVGPLGQETGGERRGLLDHVLAVVEYEQARCVAEPRDDPVHRGAAGHLRRSEGTARPSDDPTGTDHTEIDPPDSGSQPSPGPAGHLRRQAGLTGPGRANQGHQPPRPYVVLDHV